MKTINIIFIAFFCICVNCIAQTECNLSELKERIISKIEHDKEKEDDILIVKELSLTIDKEDIKEEDIFENKLRFMYGPGFTFRFYLLTSYSYNNNAQLMLYRYSKDDSIPHKLLDSVNDVSFDNEVSYFEYKNNQPDEFILSLSFEKNEPGCAMAIFVRYKNGLKEH